MKHLDRIIWSGDVERYHTMRTIRTETVHHHSAIVAHLVDLLGKYAMVSVEGRHRLVVAALRHDLAEGSDRPCGSALGDVPAPAKRGHPHIKKHFDEMEDQVLFGCGLLLPPLSVAQERLLKLADNMAGLVFCIQERTIGNNGIWRVWEAFASYVMGQNPEGFERELFDALQDRWEKAGLQYHDHDEGFRTYERK